MRDRFVLFAFIPFLLGAFLLGGCVTAGGDHVSSSIFFGVGPGTGEDWKAALKRPTRNAVTLSLLASAAALQINDADRRLQSTLEDEGYGPGGSPGAYSDIGAYGLMGSALVAPLLFTPHGESGVPGKSYAATAAYAFGANQVFVQLTKAATGRTRPNGESGSFYSGHASTAFAGAQLLQRMYGPKAGIPAYTVASLVGLYRVEAGNHFPSDVLVGAAMGIWISDMIYEKNHGEKGIYNDKPRYALMPYIGPEGVGFSLTW